MRIKIQKSILPGL